MEQLKKDIKEENFKQLYLISGEEGYLCSYYKKALKTALLGDGDPMNCTVFQGGQTEEAKIIEMAETLPFFAERRVIVLEDTGFMKNACPALADYIKDMSPTTYMIFSETQVDKRSRMYKLVKDKGRVVECPRQTTDRLEVWIAGQLKLAEKKISKAAVHELLTRTGNDMQTLHSELMKLIGYCGDREMVTPDDVKEVCSMQTVGRVFEMVNAIAEGNQKKALAEYEELLALKEPPMKILYLIAKSFNQLWLVKKLASEGKSADDIGKDTGIRPFQVKKYQAIARHYSLEQLKEAVENCVNKEESVKTGRMGDRLSVELILMEYTR